MNSGGGVVRGTRPSAAATPSRTPGRARAAQHRNARVTDALPTVDGVDTSDCVE